MKILFILILYIVPTMAFSAGADNIEPGGPPPIGENDGVRIALENAPESLQNLVHRLEKVWQDQHPEIRHQFRRVVDGRAYFITINQTAEHFDAQILRLD